MYWEAECVSRTKKKGLHTYRFLFHLLGCCSLRRIRRLCRVKSQVVEKRNINIEAQLKQMRTLWWRSVLLWVHVLRCLSCCFAAMTECEKKGRIAYTKSNHLALFAPCISPHTCVAQVKLTANTRSTGATFSDILHRCIQSGSSQNLDACAGFNSLSAWLKTTHGLNKAVILPLNSADPFFFKQSWFCWVLLE